MGRTATAPKRRSLKIHSGDQVKVIAGKDRGKTGRVMRVEPTKERLYVEGLNMVKRHMKPQQVRDTNREQTVGGVIERGPDPRVERDADRSQRRRTDARADRARERQAVACRQAHRYENRLT